MLPILRTRIPDRPSAQKGSSEKHRTVRPERIVGKVKSSAGKSHPIDNAVKTKCRPPMTMGERIDRLKKLLKNANLQRPRQKEEDEKLNGQESDRMLRVDLPGDKVALRPSYRNFVR